MNQKTIELIGYRLRMYGFKNLQEYYSSSKWKSLRDRVKNGKQYPYKCCVCGAKNQLQLHHKSYKSLCAESLNHLIWLCHQCHKDVHRLADKKGWSIGYATKKFRRKQNKWKRTQKRITEETKKIRGDKHMKGLIRTRHGAKAKDLNKYNTSPVKSYFVDPSTL